MNFMKKMTVAILTAGATLAVNASWAVPADNGGVTAFEQMKVLVGDWQTDSSATGKATLHLQLTSGGTALLEKFRMEENGKPVEMITLYYLDGDQLKLTH